MLAGDIGVFPLILKSSNCGGYEPKRSPTRLWGGATNPHREGEMNLPKQSPGPFRGHKAYKTTLDSLVAFEDLALQLPLISLGCK